MSLHSNHADRFDQLEQQIRVARAVTPDLVSGVLAGACLRLPALTNTNKAASIARLIEADAWTDAALAIIELESPQWKLRRLVYEDGEWHCQLSNQRELPAGLDETAEACHEFLPLAILGAFLETRRRGPTMREAERPGVPQVRPAAHDAVSVDNFA
jgi:hypothetical protein